MISINKPHTGFDDPELTLRWDYPHLNDPQAFWGRVRTRLDESAAGR